MTNINFDNNNLIILKTLRGTSSLTKFIINFHDQINYSNVPFELLIEAFKKKTESCIEDHPDKKTFENIIHKNKDIFLNEENYTLLLETDFNFTIKQIIKNKHPIPMISDYFIKNIKYPDYILLESLKLLPDNNSINNNNYFALDQNIFEYLENKNAIFIDKNKRYNPLEQLIFDINSSELFLSKNEIQLLNEKIKSMSDKYIIKEDNISDMINLLLFNKINQENFEYIVKKTNLKYDFYKYINMEDFINKKTSITHKKKIFLIENYFFENKHNIDIISLLHKSLKYSKGIIDILIDNKDLGFNYKNLLSPFLLRKQDLCVWDFSKGCFSEHYNSYKNDIINDKDIVDKIYNKVFPFDLLKNKNSVNAIAAEIIHLKDFFDFSTTNEYLLKYLTNNGQRKNNIKKLLISLSDDQEFKIFINNLKKENPETYLDVFDMEKGYIIKHLDLKSIYESKILKMEISNINNNPVNKKRL